MFIQNQPLTSLQLELLKIYSFGIKDEQLLEIKQLLVHYFAQKATEEADRLWEEKNWTNDTMRAWLKGE
ncbi:MAG: hypothetical protein AAF806_07950 [Bacteroidota bacterium]